MFTFIVVVKRIYDKYSADEMTVYAAQVTFFMILSAVPFIMLLLSAIQLVPSLSEKQLLEAVARYVPTDYKVLARRIINDLLIKSPATVLSVTAVTAFWSAGRGMFGIARGLNRAYGRDRKRPYIIGRLVCSGYTVILLLVCVMSLGFLVFGSVLQEAIETYFPLVGGLIYRLLDLRDLWTAVLLFIFFLGVYAFVPDRRLRVRDQVPGAACASVGWMVFSLVFSLYFKYFGGGNYSYMYGSLTALVLLLLWLYFCMCILFFGAEVNYIWEVVRHMHPMMFDED